MKKLGYKHKFYYVNFDNLIRSYRFNQLKVVNDKTTLMQIMEDMLLSLQSKDTKQDEWFAGGLGILRGWLTDFGTNIESLVQYHIFFLLLQMHRSRS